MLELGQLLLKQFIRNIFGIVFDDVSFFFLLYRFNFVIILRIGLVSAL
jgi:hypothetical protein